MKIITIQSRTSDLAAQVITTIMVALGFTVGKRGLLITYNELDRTATLECDDKETLSWFRVYGTALLGMKLKQHYWEKSIDGHIIHNMVVDTSKPYLKFNNTDYLKQLNH
jgi:hypothetical protein